MDGQHGIRQSAQMVIEDRLCRVQLIEGHGPDQVRLLNASLVGVAPDNAERVGVGDLLEVEGAAGLFRVARVGAGLMVDPVPLTGD